MNLKVRWNQKLAIEFVCLGSCTSVDKVLLWDRNLAATHWTKPTWALQQKARFLFLMLKRFCALQIDRELAAVARMWDGYKQAWGLNKASVRVFFGLLFNFLLSFYCQVWVFGAFHFHCCVLCRRWVNWLNRSQLFKNIETDFWSFQRESGRKKAW